MKKIFTIIASSLFMANAMAQTPWEHRGRIENVTDYSQLPTQGPRRVGKAGYPLPCTGTKNIPVILVQFSDLKMVSANSDAEAHEVFQKFCNGDGENSYYTGAKSSAAVREYFINQSDSLFTPNFSVIGPVTLDKGYAYYGSNQGGKDANISKFYSEACEKAIKDFDVDWDTFDSNNDGKVDFVFFIFAGEGENGGFGSDYIWPKESISAMTVKAGDKDITFASFGCTNEVYKGKLDGIGTMCHELSHGLGLCDHYDYNQSLFGMDYWDIMDCGCYCIDSYRPCGYSAYERDFLGWRKLEEIEHGKQLTLYLEPTYLGGKGYKIADPRNPNYYYTLENRQNMQFDSYLGCVVSKFVSGGDTIKMAGNTHGLMVTRIKYDTNTWSSNRVNTGSEHLTLQHADGLNISRHSNNTKSYLNSMLGDLYPGNSDNHSFELFGNTFEVEELSSDDLPTIVSNILTAKYAPTSDINKDEAVTISDVANYNNPTSSTAQPTYIRLLVNGGDPSSIESISKKSDKESATPFYDLSGRIIKAPSLGIYIKDGKKVLVK